MEKIETRKKYRDDTARMVADIFDVSPRYVRMVSNGDANNEAILSVYIHIKQVKSLLVSKLKKKHCSN